MVSYADLPGGNIGMRLWHDFNNSEGNVKMDKCPWCGKDVRRTLRHIEEQAAEITRLQTALERIVTMDIIAHCTCEDTIKAIKAIARSAREKRDYKAARGVLPWQEGDEPAEDAIRRLRGKG